MSMTSTLLFRNKIRRASGLGDDIDLNEEKVLKQASMEFLAIFIDSYGTNLKN